MFGRQAVSTRASAPSFGFGSGAREMPSKLFVSGAHQRDFHEENEVVGPGTYSLVSPLMQSKLSQHRSAPRLHFGTGKRFGEPGRGARRPRRRSSSRRAASASCAIRAPVPSLRLR